MASRRCPFLSFFTVLNQSPIHQYLAERHIIHIYRRSRYPRHQQTGGKAIDPYKQA